MNVEQTESAYVGNPQSWNRYSYNSPLRFTDPTGMVTGDYYDSHGNWIANDNFKDGKNYLVPNPAEAAQIRQDTANGRDVSTPHDYTSLLELPSQAIRNEIQNAVTRSDHPSGGHTPTDDTHGRFHEEGGVGILTANGQQPVPALPGPVQNPQSGQPATINLLNMSPASQQLLLTATSTDFVLEWHVHPSGSTTTTSGNTVTTHFSNQPSSNADRTAAGNRPSLLGYHIVVGARDKTVYFYNSSPTNLGTMPLNRFVNLPPRQSP